MKLEKRNIHPKYENAGATGYRITLEAAETACDAENLGKRLAYALLKIALNRNYGILLSWHDTPLPCRVIDRTASVGSSLEGFITAVSSITISDFTHSLDTNFSEVESVPYRLLLSLELCVSSRLVDDSRVRLIMLISALEALAEQQD